MASRSAEREHALRRALAAGAIAWTLLSVGLSLGSFLALAFRPSHPFIATAVTGRYVIVGPDDAATGAGIRRGDLLLAVNGMRLADRPLSRAQVRTDGPNRYLLERPDGAVHEVELPHRELDLRSLLEMPATYVMALLLLFVALYLVVGIGVYRARPELRSSGMLLLLSAFVASYLSGALHPGERLPGTELVLGLSAAVMLVPGFRLVTLYPVELDAVRRRRGLLLVPYLLALLLFGAQALAYASGRGYEAAMRALLYWNLSIAAATGAYMALARRRLPTRDLRDRLDIALLGYALAAAPTGVVLLFQDVLRATLPSLFAFAWFVCFPLAVGLGILRQQMFGIRDVAKSSFVYGILSVAITASYALAVALVGTLYGGAELANPWVSLPLIFALVLALSPLRGRLQRTAERLFERERGRYEETVRAASEALVSLLPLGDLLDRVLWAVTGPMGVEGAVVLLRSGPRGDYSPAAARARSLPEGWRIPAEHPLVKLVWAYRDGLSREDLALRVLPEALAGCQEVFRELDAGLILPLAFGVDLRGLLAVGTRRGLEPFRTEERQILRTLANQAAVAIENALAYDEIARLNQSLESRIEARTRELREAQAALAEREKMASLGQLVAGVAHEINNPVALVHSNLALLGEQVERLVRAVDESDPSAAARAREHLARLVERSLEGTRRIGGIVRALRTFSRVDQPELGEADLLEGLETTLALLSPRLHGIEVIREIEPLPKVRCHAGQIHQVLMNLLLNACDAGATRIVIRAAARGERVWIEVEDNGAGIPPENRPRLFEPFFTTKGVGEGTGLGLAISHGIVERHGGRIRLARSGREGTAFEMEIPISGPPPEAAPAASVARS